MEIDYLAIAIAFCGMILGILRDAARAEAADDEFSFGPWLGERPWQLVGRLTVVVAVFAPGAAHVAGEIVALAAEIPPEAAGVAIPALGGFYGDKVVKTVLEKVEDALSGVPGFGHLINLGKKLT